MQTISTLNAPKAIGPYSQGVIHNGILYTAGQLALLPKTMSLAQGGIENQTNQVLANLNAILEEAKTSRENVIKSTIYLKNLEDFAAVNKIYSDFFGGHKPARSTVEVSGLPKGALLEIDLIASI